MAEQPVPGVQQGGQEPDPAEQDRPEQNVGYDEAVKGAPLGPEERRRAEDEAATEP
jgi:hypothetical protein